MSRPVGKQIRAALDASERLGRPATAKELFEESGLFAVSTNRTRAIKRAVQYGLMVEFVDRHPGEFQARPGWRLLINQPKISEKKEKPVRVITRAKPKIPKINSVWALAL